MTAVVRMLSAAVILFRIPILILIVFVAAFILSIIFVMLVSLAFSFAITIVMPLLLDPVIMLGMVSV